MALVYEDETPAAQPAKRGGLVFDDETPAPPVSSSPAAAGGFGRGGRAPSAETLAAMRDNGFSRTVQGAIDDPVGTIKAIPAGFNKGVVSLAGMPVDTVTSAVDLLGMAYGAGRSLAHQGDLGASLDYYTPQDRAQTFGSGEHLSGLLDRGVTALGGSPVTQNPAPNNPAARLAYATASGVPGALTGRAALAGGFGGAGSQIVAEAGGSPGAQAIAGLVGGRAVEGRAPKPTQGGTFGRDSASAAAATPDLGNVPADLRAPLVQAFQRGDRDVVERVVRAETLPIPIRMMEGQARGDSTLHADEFNLRGTDKRIANAFDEQNQALIDNLDTIRREVSPQVVAADHIQNGQQLVDAYKAYDAPQRERITAMYKALEDANGGQLPLNAGAFVKAADAGLAKKFKTRYLPAEIAGDLNEFREAGGMMTFEQLENMRTNLAAAGRKADAARDGNASAAINEVRRALETAPMDAPPALKKLADDARSAARARFEAIDADPAYRAAVDDDVPHGEASALADDFVKKHVVGGKSANLARMQQALSGDPVAVETIAAAALNYVKSKSGINPVTNEGNFSQHGFNTALAAILPKIQHLVPGKTAELLQQLGQVASDLQLQRKGGTFNNSGTFSAAAREASKGYAEGVLNTVVPGANLGSFVRKRRADNRDKDRARRALDPRRYLTADNSE